MFSQPGVKLMNSSDVGSTSPLVYRFQQSRKRKKERKDSGNKDYTNQIGPAYPANLRGRM